MRPRSLLTVVLAVVAVVGAAATLGALWWAADWAAARGAAIERESLVYGAAGLLVLFAVFAAAWAVVEVRLLRPLTTLSRQVHTTARSRGERGIQLTGGHALGRLPDDVVALATEVIAGRREMVKAMAAATARADEEKSRLEAILIDLSEGVLVCSLDHRLMLYNQSAVRILGAPDQLGLGRSLFGLVTQEPIEHTLEQLQLRLRAGSDPSPADHGTSFVCATVDARSLLQGRMSLVLGADGTATGYVLTLADISKDIVELANRDSLLRQATDGLRAPVANLRAAAETLATFPDLAGSERAAFEQVVFKESTTLSERLESLTAAHHRLISRQWPLSDIYSADLINCIIRHLEDRDGHAVTMIGLPLWLRGDSHFLMLALEHLIRQIGAWSGCQAFDIEPLMGDRNIYLDIIWRGRVVPSATLDQWLDVPLERAIGERTARQVLDHHGSEVWSQASKRSGQALLRIPLPVPRRDQFEWPREARPQRPEFYDFDLMRRQAATGDLGQRLLRELNFVVFDTETTGLRPSAGDEVVSLGAVRIVNGRILAGETFTRLVNPMRPIPQASIRFHHITDDMVRGKPPIQAVLPQFKAFAGNAILVAHNAAFDMKFLKVKEAECGVRFDNTVLDTLLLSVFLHGDATDHTLDGIAQRFGVEVAQRHTALGDAMVTAGILIHLLELLEARGVRTLDEALEACEGLLEIRKQQVNY